jgi:lactoylglutathione lyase
MQLDHITVHVVDMSRSAHFYGQILGLESIPEPFHDGLHLWYGIGTGLALHVIGGASPIPTPSIQLHFALRVSSLDPVMQRLDLHHVTYRNLKGDASINIRPDGLRQIYLQDPDGYWIEINEAGNGRASTI